MRRREFIAGIGSAAAWPMVARAQQAAMPVIALINGAAAGGSADFAAAFRRGLRETGYVEGQNLMVEYHWLDSQYDRVPALMADLVRRRVSVIATPASTIAAIAAKAATATIPIVFGVGRDPVKLGLVASLARPGGNATGVNFFNTEVAAKRLAQSEMHQGTKSRGVGTDSAAGQTALFSGTRGRGRLVGSLNQPGGNLTGFNFMTAELSAKRLGLMRELLPGALRFGMLINPNSPSADIQDTQAAATTLGRRIELLFASSSREIDAAFASLGQKQIEALIVSSSTLFANRRVHLAMAAMRYAMPVIYSDCQ